MGGQAAPVVLDARISVDSVIDKQSGRSFRVVRLGLTLIQDH